MPPVRPTNRLQGTLLGPCKSGSDRPEANRHPHPRGVRSRMVSGSSVKVSSDSEPEPKRFQLFRSSSDSFFSLASLIRYSIQFIVLRPARPKNLGQLSPPRGYVPARSSSLSFSLPHAFLLRSHNHFCLPQPYLAAGIMEALRRNFSTAVCSIVDPPTSRPLDRSSVFPAKLPSRGDLYFRTPL